MLQYKASKSFGILPARASRWRTPAFVFFFTLFGLNHCVSLQTHFFKHN